MLLMLIPLGAAAEVPNPALSVRLEQVSQAMTGEVEFVEERHSEVLAEPLVSRGRLAYRTEDRSLVKQVVSPEPARLVVTQRHILVESGERSRRLSLRSRPELRALLEGFRALIEGDLALMESQFEVAYHTLGEDRWRLTLTPRGRRLARHVESVQVDGAGNQVDGICTRLTNGEWQHMTLVHDD